MQYLLILHVVWLRDVNVLLSVCVPRPQALKQMGGALRDKYEAWRTELKGCLAHAEAVIDFGDDEVQLYRRCASLTSHCSVSAVCLPAACTKVDRAYVCDLALGAQDEQCEVDLNRFNTVGQTKPRSPPPPALRCFLKSLAL